MAMFVKAGTPMPYVLAKPLTRSWAT